jgi:hypothetical protein
MMLPALLVVILAEVLVVVFTATNVCPTIVSIVVEAPEIS